MKYKYRCKSEEDSKRVQEALFDMGYRWRDLTTKVKYVDNEWLFIDEDENIISTTWKSSFGDTIDYPELIL